MGERHTLTPWWAPLKDLDLGPFDHNFEAYPTIDGESGPVFVARSAEDAAFIVTACNSYDEMVAFLKSLAEDDNEYGRMTGSTRRQLWQIMPRPADGL